MKVADILARKGSSVETVGPDERIELALHRMTSKGIGALVVVDREGAVAGVLAERDIVRGLARHGAAVLTMPVRAVLPGTYSTCAPSDDIATVMRRMTHGRQRHLPVVERGELRGIVSIGDVVKHRLDELELERHVLRDAYLART